VYCVTHLNYVSHYKTMPRSSALIVTKHNHLIEATYMLSLSEQRLLLLTIARIDSRAILEPGICHTITASEIADSYSLPRDQAYELLINVAERLYERSVVICDPDPDRPDVSQLRTRWVASIRYLPSRGSIELIFAPAILPFLSQLKRKFSSYRLEHVAPMTSIYAIRLYELLIQWRETGTRTVEIDWLRERFELGDKYPNIRDLKARVLNPAIDQINAHSDLYVKWEQHKRGRVVHALTFTFGPKAGQKSEAKPQSPAKSAKPKLSRAYIEQHAQPGESWEEATERCRRKLEQESA